MPPPTVVSRPKFEIIFETSRLRYEKRTGQQLDATLAASLTTVADLRNHIERQNGKFDAFRDKDKHIFDRLNSALAPIERLGQYVAAGTSTGFPPAGACFGAVALMIKSAQDVSTHYDRILELFSIMGGIMDRFELHNLDRITPQLEENFANVLATVLEIIGLSTKAIVRKRWKEYFARVFKGDDEKLEELRQRLDRLVQDGTALVIEQINNSVNAIGDQTVRTDTKVEALQNTTARIGVGIESLKDGNNAIMDLLLKQLNTKRENDLSDILQPAQMNTDKIESILRERVPQTGSWLLNELDFQSWLKRDEPLLYISGNPGSGKTFLASSVVSLIQSKIAHGSDPCRGAVVGFFFFTKDTHCRIGGFHQALRDIAWQITRFSSDYAGHVSTQCRSWADIETLASAWRILFSSYFEVPGRTLYLVLDGIDEVHENGDYGLHNFLKLLADIQGPLRVNINLLLLGRPHLTNSIRLAVYDPQTKMATINVEAHKNRADLRQYIKRGIGRLQLHGASADLEIRIRDTLEAKAQGMFLWVKLMLDILEAQPTEQHILDHLATAPPDIEGIIREMLKVYSSTLKGREPEEFNTILAWISCSARPLSLAELAAILGRLSPTGSRVLSLERKLRERFGSLITLVRDDGLSTGMLQSHLNWSKSNAVLYSNPKTTTVVCSHASIAEYLRKGEGKYSVRKTAPKIGVVLLEAQYTILATCLDVFLNPGIGERLSCALDLQGYARDHWYSHIERCQSALVNTLAMGQSRLLHSLYSFMSDENVLRTWCRDIPWSFYTSEKATVLAKCIKTWNVDGHGHLDPALHAWISGVNARPVTIFTPIAKINAQEGLHGDVWLAHPAVCVITQIKALVEDEDTLDTLPERVPLQTLMKAIEWAGLEKTATWNRKVAVCLRESGYMNECVHYFETAFAMKPSFVDARSGLAIVYQRLGYFAKVIDLEFTNTAFLLEQQQQQDLSAERRQHLKKQLANSYTAIAHNYQELGDIPHALKYWQKATDTGEIVMWGIFRHLGLLEKSAKESRWEDIMSIARAMQVRKENATQNRLTACILLSPWPTEDDDDFFHIIAKAAALTDSIDWLVKAYETAMTESSSHITAVVLKLSIIDIFREIVGVPKRAEPYIEELVDIACLDYDGKVRDLEMCKESVAQDYCQICVRKAITATSASEAQHWRQKLSNLCRSGLWPRDMAGKLSFGEYSYLYHALLTRLAGENEEALRVAQPFLEECCSGTLSSDATFSKIAVLALTRSLVAFGQKSDAVDVFHFGYARSAWVCSVCREFNAGVNYNALCEYCLVFFCGKCVQLPDLPTKYCVPGHRLLRIPCPQSIPRSGELFRFRGQETSLAELVQILRVQWGISILSDFGEFGPVAKL